MQYPDVGIIIWIKYCMSLHNMEKLIKRAEASIKNISPQPFNPRLCVLFSVGQW